MELVVFVLASAMVLLGAVGVIAFRNPVHAALGLILTLFGVAVHFVSMEAHFLAAVQVIVYAGAIVVLFLFVIMLLQVDAQPSMGRESGAGRIVLAGVTAVVLLTVFGLRDLSQGLVEVPSSGVPVETQDTVAWLANALFTRHLVAFELASVVLVGAMAGVMVYTTRRRAAAAEGSE